MTKRFVKFASLFAVVAMFLGLMVTGCSEGNNTLATPTSDKTILSATVGFKETGSKMDCPTEATYLSVTLYNADGEIDDTTAYYGEKAEKEVTIDGEKVAVNEWVDNEDNTVTMLMDITDEMLAENPTYVSVGAYDKDGALLGGYLMDKTFTKGDVVDCDFVNDDEIGFIAIDDFDKDISVVGVKDGVLDIYLNEETNVNVQMNYYYEKQLFHSSPVAGFVMEPKSENITVDNTNATITGTVASEGNGLDVTFLQGQKSYKTSIKVDVGGVTVALTCQSDDLMPDFDNGDKVVIESLYINGTEKLTDLTWDGSKSKDFFALTDELEDEDAVGVGDAVKVDVTLVKADGAEYAGACAEHTVKSSEADANMMYVTAWNPFTFDVKIFCNEGLEMEAGDQLTVTYTVGEKAVDPFKKTLEADTSEIAFTKASAGVEVAVSEIEIVREVEEEEVTYTAEFSPPNLTVSKTEDDNVFTVSAWNKK